VLVELRKAVDTRAARWLLAVIVVVPFGIAILQLLLSKLPEERGLAGAFTAIQGLGLVLLPVVGLLSVTSEWSQRTTMTTYALVPRRHRVTAAKAAAVSLLSLALTALALALAAALNALAPLLTDGGGQWDLSVRVTAQSALVGVVTVLGGLAFGLMLISTPLAIVLYYVLPIALTTVAETVGSLRERLLWLDINVTVIPLYTTDVSAGQWARLATSVAAWVAVPLALGWVRTARREVA
jgi:hypothetical protein